MLHASETWPLTKRNLQPNDRAMIRQICSIEPEDVATVKSCKLYVLAKIELEDLNHILRERWGVGGGGARRPKLTWKKLMEDCCEWKLTTVDPQERSTWRSGVRSAMCAASQSPGRRPTDVDDVPARVQHSKFRL